MWYRDSSSQFKEFQDGVLHTYTVPELINLRGREWYSITAKDVNDNRLGTFLLPIKYYPLWGRLVYAALSQEKMFEAWIRRTKRLKKRELNAIEEEEIRLRNNAGVRLVQYLLCRRLVLEELMKLRFENDEPVFLSLIEFGIRDSRDWLFETYENAKNTRCKIPLSGSYTIKKHKRVWCVPRLISISSVFTRILLEKGYVKGLELLNPPEDDGW